MGLIAWFLILLLIQYGLSYLFVLCGITSPYIIDALIDVILAFIFAIAYYRGPRKEAFKDVNFHRSVALYFVILIGMSLLYWFVF